MTLSVKMKFFIWQSKLLENTHVNGHFSGTTQVSQYQKGITNRILLKQETVSGSGISWDICKSAHRSRQITTPAPPLSFLQARCPSCRPTNSVETLKALKKMKQHEAPRLSGLVAEMIQATGDIGFM